MTKPISRKMAVSCLLHIAMKGEFPTKIGIKECPREGAFSQFSTYGFFCSICDDIIHPDDDIQFDHIHADVFGGPHEYQNLRPVHTECHKSKTARDIKDNAKAKRIANGGKKVKSPMPKKPKGYKHKWAKRGFCNAS